MTSSYEIYNATFLGEVKPGREFEISFTIQNVKSTASLPITVFVPPQANGLVKMSVKPHSSIPGYGEITAKALIKVNAVPTFKRYPQKIKIQLKAIEQVVHEEDIQIPASVLALNLKALALPVGVPKLNILIFGEYGSGKTSLNLTFLSAVNGRLILTHPSLGLIGGGSDHASTTFREIRVTDKISIWDPWGASPANYKSDEFKWMLNGAMKKDWDMNARLVLKDMVPLAQQPQQRPDAVFFIITQGLVEDPGYIARLRSWIEILKAERTDMQAFIILTKIDEIDQNLRKNPSFDNPLVQDKIERIAAETGVPEMFVFPTISYKSERENSEFIDRLAIDILTTAAIQATNARGNF